MESNVVIEPGDAVDHGLPPVRIVLDIAGTHMNPGLFPNSETYVFMSGPPGSPMFFTIMTIREPITHGEALERFVRAHNNDSTLSFGERGWTAIQGEDYPAMLYSTGMSAAAAKCCAIYVPPPEGATALGLVILFGNSAGEGETTCSDIASTPPFDHLLDLIKWNLVPGDDDDGDDVDGDDEEDAEDADEEELEEEEDEEKPHPTSTSRPAPAIPTPATAAVLLKYIREIRDRVKAMGYWSDAMPQQDDFRTWPQLKIQMWSIQATLQAMEQSIQQTASRNPNEPVYGVVDMLKNWTTMSADPAAAELKTLLERGPPP